MRYYQYDHVLSAQLRPGRDGPVLREDVRRRSYARRLFARHIVGLSNKTALAMVFKLVEGAQKSWRGSTAITSCQNSSRV